MTTGMLSAWLWNHGHGKDKKEKEGHRLLRVETEIPDKLKAKRNQSVVLHIICLDCNGVSFHYDSVPFNKFYMNTL